MKMIVSIYRHIIDDVKSLRLSYVMS